MPLYLDYLHSITGSRDSSVGIATGYGVDGRGSITGRGNSSFTLALGPTQPPIQRVPGAISPGLKGPGCEADQSPPFTA
jgi:hypothetical protein